MKALVTGGNGFLGAEIVRQLSQREFQVDVIDLKLEELHEATNVFDIDLCDDLATQEFFKKAKYDYIFHLAAVSDLGKAEESFQITFKSNVVSTINLIENIKSQSSTKFIFSSSMYVFGERGGNYRLSKQICELIIQEMTRKYSLSASVIRFGSIYGPGSTKENGLHRIVLDALLSPEIIYEGSANSLRQYIHVRDAARECIEIAEKQSEGITFHLITGDQAFRMEDVLRMVNEMTGNDKELRFLNKAEEGHFAYTPFTFKPAPALKYPSFKSVDLGQGLWELINYVALTISED